LVVVCHLGGLRVAALLLGVAIGLHTLLHSLTHSLVGLTIHLLLLGLLSLLDTGGSIVIVGNILTARQIISIYHLLEVCIHFLQVVGSERTFRTHHGEDILARLLQVELTHLVYFALSVVVFNRLDSGSIRAQDVTFARVSDQNILKNLIHF
jgi:hypothetical protein